MDTGSPTRAPPPSPPPGPAPLPVGAAGGAPRRRSWRAVGLGVIALGLFVGVGLGVRYRYSWLGLLESVAHRVAGIGDLSWKDAEGQWHPVSTVDSHRRQWGPTDAFLAPSFTEIAPGLELGELRVARSPNPLEVALVLVRVDPARARFRVVSDPTWTERPVSEWARKEKLAVAVNASFFAEDGPIGLVVAEGRLRHRPASKRAAHFLVDGPGRRPRIVNSRGADLAGVAEGFQGFPAVMTGGRTFSYMRTGGRGFPVLEVDRRAAACVDREDHVLLLVTDTLTNGLTFDELATVLGGLGCVDAMGFDGGGSAALSVTVSGHRRDVTGTNPVPVVLGVEPLRSVPRPPRAPREP